MIITVKNLQQQTFTIDFDPEKKVLELKEKIYKERGVEYVVEKQKLIYAGVILENDRTIASYKVDEKKFIVVMLTRDIASAQQHKPDETTASGGGTSSTGATDNKHSSTQQAHIDKEIVQKTENEKSVGEQLKLTVHCDGGESSSSNTIGASSAAAPDISQSNYSSNDLVGVLANASLQSRAESNLLMGDEYNRTVDSMIEMGYGREMVERAMAASFNNPERAVEYLISGIPPEHDDGFNTVPASDNASITAAVESSIGDVGNRGGGIGGTSSNISSATSATIADADPFEFLRSQPQFLQMRSLVYQNPDLLHAVLQQIGQTNPALLQLISENQDAFLDMLNQPLEGDANGGQQARRLLSNRRSAAQQSSANIETLAETLRAAAGSERPSTTTSERDPVEALSTTANDRRPAAGDDEGGVATIRLTPQDRDAIDRLKALGFPEPLVLQAYFACEKDEQLAANFLISSAFDD